jgi:hypothetical protein
VGNIASYQPEMSGTLLHTRQVENDVAALAMSSNSSASCGPSSTCTLTSDGILLTAAGVSTLSSAVGSSELGAPSATGTSASLVIHCFPQRLELTWV